jgi:hypothetical protein
MTTQIELTGSAYSPINPFWSSIGETQVTFDLAGGTPGIPGQTLDAAVTNFSLVLGGNTFALMDHAVGQYYLSPTQSGLAIYGPNEQFVWTFWGPTWDGGQAAFRNEMTQMDFTIGHAAVTQVPEPSTLCLLTAAALIGVLHARKARRSYQR